MSFLNYNERRQIITMCKFDIKPKNKTVFKGRQTYWKAGALPIPKQRNDDNRLGGDEQLEFNEHEASENISKIIKSPGYKKLSRGAKSEINKFVNAEHRRGY